MPAKAFSAGVVDGHVPVFQPCAFGGVREPVTFSDASAPLPPLASLTVTSPLALLPSASTAVARFRVPAVFALCVSVGGVREATPAASTAVQVMVTLSLFQPAAFGRGKRVGVTTDRCCPGRTTPCSS
jgi:hypothetical protein